MGVRDLAQGARSPPGCRAGELSAAIVSADDHLRAGWRLVVAELPAGWPASRSGQLLPAGGAVYCDGIGFTPRVDEPVAPMRSGADDAPSDGCKRPSQPGSRDMPMSTLDRRGGQCAKFEPGKLGRCGLRRGDRQARVPWVRRVFQSWATARPRDLFTVDSAVGPRCSASGRYAARPDGICRAAW